MMKSAVIVGLVLLVGTRVAAYGQGNGTAIVAVHPGTAILDSMGISAGVDVSVGGLVQPGTVILDSMQIYAGAPTPDSTVADNGCQVRNRPQHGG